MFPSWTSRVRSPSPAPAFPITWRHLPTGWLQSGSIHIIRRADSSLLTASRTALTGVSQGSWKGAAWGRIRSPTREEAASTSCRLLPGSESVAVVIGEGRALSERLPQRAPVSASYCVAASGGFIQRVFMSGRS